MIRRKVNLLKLFTLNLFIFALVLTVMNFIFSLYHFGLLTLGSASILLGCLIIDQ